MTQRNDLVALARVKIDGTLFEAGAPIGEVDVSAVRIARLIENGRIGAPENDPVDATPADPDPAPDDNPEAKTGGGKGKGK